MLEPSNIEGKCVSHNPKPETFKYHMIYASYLLAVSLGLLSAGTINFQIHIPPFFVRNRDTLVHYDLKIL